MEKALFALFDTGTAFANGCTGNLAELPWKAHPKFAGVALKDIVAASRFTCHLVQVEPEHAIGLHTHTDSIELHEVISGSGICRTEQGDVVYTPGTVAVMEANAPHEVVAGKDGLCLFAKFISTAP